MSQANDYQRDRRAAMYEATPSYYHELVEAQEILDRQAELLDQIHADMYDVLAQFFVDTATWGLASWERIFGLPTDETKPIEERRSLIKARMRGTGTVTKTMVENVAESWYGGDVEVTENPAEYTITVKFVSSYGVPTNLNDVEKALRELIPAHLAINFEFTYLLIRDIHNVMTLAQLEATTLDKFAGGA
jgi:hypothetical protein